MRKYILDSNVFIQAHRMHYPFDVFPSFWDKLANLSNTGCLISIDKVKKELCDNSTPDQLSTWCIEKPASNFFVDTASCVDKYAEIAVWIHSHTHFTQIAKDEFLRTDLADPWLVAYAAKNDCIIVTHETSDPNSKKRIKIPQPCLAFGVQYVTPIQMFRSLGQIF